MTAKDEWADKARKLEREAEVLRTALREARCWIGDGSRKTPEQRGALKETCLEALEQIDAALSGERSDTPETEKKHEDRIRDSRDGEVL